ncbi:hypothetical protein NHF46_11465 [Arthrobacter alpinus]|nr:hypothetical protein [Arthrobacter alpinus]
MLTTVCIVAVLASVALRSWSTAESPLEQAMARGQDMVLTLSLKNSPRPLGMENGPQRVAFDAVVLTASAKGQFMAGRLPVRVVASMAWAGLQAGDRAVTAGIIVPAGERDSVAGLLRPSTVPQAVKAAEGGSQAAVAAIRTSWISAVHEVWDKGSSDTAGLLPGMVMGDRAGMDKKS